jgi:hypothetical protein
LTLIEMVPIETVPSEARAKDATRLLVVVEYAASEESTDSQFSPENEAESATLVSCSCSWVISDWIFALVDAGFLGGDELGLDLVDDLDGGGGRRVGRVDLRGAEAESVLDGRQRLVVGTHGGRNRPIGRVVACFGDAVTGRDPRLGFLEACWSTEGSSEPSSPTR